MRNTRTWGAIKCEPDCGPIFGYDIYIVDKCNKENNCCIGNNGFWRYDCHPQYKSSLYVNTNGYNKKDDEENEFSVLDYEVFTPE